MIMKNIQGFLGVVAVILLVAFLFAGCAATNKSSKLVIKGFQMLIVSESATDNIEPVKGSDFEADSTIPMSGVPVPFNVAYKSGNSILNRESIEIIGGATDSIIVIERAVSGNSGVKISDAMPKIFKPTEHPFGNITIQGGDAMREHVVDTPPPSGIEEKLPDVR